MTGEQLRSSFRGQISRVRIATRQVPGLLDPLNLSHMARLALNYLRGNPDPTRDYECKFTLGPLGIPCHCPEGTGPGPHAYDPISLGDTDCRMYWQYANMRRMAGGEPLPCPVETGVRDRVMGYLREDGYAWINPAAYVGHSVDGLWIGTWTTAKLLWSLAEAWQREGDSVTRRKARRIFEALRDLARWDGERAWYMGIAPHRDGQWLMDGWCDQHGRNYPFIVGALVRYWECTGDQEALDLAVAFAEGFLAGSQPDMGSQRIDPQTGAFTGHVHLHTHAVWGVAHLGVVTGDRRYLDWARLAYEFVKEHGTDYGWYPESIPQGAYRSEICVVGDMVSLGAWLARGLSPDYWDDIERTIRNVIARSQFLLTAPFVDLFRRVHHGKPTAVVEAALRQLQGLEGGFVAQATFDDWVSYPGNPTLGAPGMSNNGIHMMGCCPPEGMRALWEAWNGTVEELAGEVRVNLAFTRDHPAARVAACRPEDGEYRVVTQRTGRFLLRVPAWARGAAVVLLRGGQEAPLRWAGPGNAYIAVEDCERGETLTVRVPVPRFTQTFSACSVPEREQEVAVQWEGHAVTGVSPAGQHLPMFTGG